MNYRKKPVVIEAFQYFDDMGTHTAVIPMWFIDATVSGTVYCKGKETFIKTPVAEHKLCDGDYVIHGEKGEIYPCKPDIFLLAYDSYTEAAEPPPNPPAFPGPGSSGVDLRDYFAAAISTGYVSVPSERRYKANDGLTVEEWIKSEAANDAKYIYLLADAMLSERAKK